jgi:inosine-uridine nucleoside N-ribohydrolase
VNGEGAGAEPGPGERSGRGADAAASGGAGRGGASASQGEGAGDAAASGRARPAIILDCDPGHDDALAIAMAGRHTELLGVTTVAGNVPLNLTTRNALAVTQVLGLAVPVHAGSPRPIVAEGRTAEFIHGASGLDGPPLPELTRSPASHDAVRFIVDTVRARPGEVWLVATGPLTNVALALRVAPDLGDRLAGIAIMGGGVPFGNATPAAEFNILVDPEAAHVVFGSGVRLIMAGLNVTHQWMVDSEVTGRIRERGGDAAGFCAALLDYYGQSYARAFSVREAGPLHDPCAVLAITHPELFERAPHHVEVELTGAHTRGMTVADLRGNRTTAPANVELLTRIDAEAANDLLVETLAAYG